MQDASIRVRAFEPEDAPQLTEVMNQPLAVWGTLQLPYTSVAARAEAAKGRSGLTRLVAVADDRVVGVIGLEQFDRRRGHAATIGMAVHDAYAGRGCGRALLGAVTEQADRWLNIRRIELTVWSDNARAIALYESFGFSREGTHIAYAFRDGAYVDAISMARLRGI